MMADCDGWHGRTQSDHILYLKLKQEQEYKDRRAFIENCPLFKSWSPKFRRLLEMSVHKDVFPFGSYIVRQGNTVQGLHFIVRGQAQVTVRPALHKQQYPKCFEPPTSVISREFGKNQQQKWELACQSVQKSQICVRRKQGYAAAERRIADQTVTVSCIDKNEVIGDVEIILGLDTYTNSVVCMTHTEAFLLDVKNLERLVYKKNITTMNMLTKIVEDKLALRKDSLQVGQKVELYKNLYGKVLELKPEHVSSSSDNKECINQQEGMATTRTMVRELAGTRSESMAQLVKLFLKDRSPLISPSVPKSLYYMAKSQQRAEQAELKAKRKGADSSLSSNVRLERARKYSRRKPLSRRELERMCAGEPATNVKQYSQNKDHVIGRILNLRPGARTPGIGKSRPHTAIPRQSTTPPRAIVAQSSDVTAPVLPKSARAYVVTAYGHLVDIPGFPSGPGAQQFGEDDIDGDALRNVMSDIGNYQQLRHNARSKIICSMLEKKTTQSPMRYLLRPKSAPVPPGSVEVESGPEGDAADEHFDWDTSEPALQVLEGKIKGFLDKYENCTPGPEMDPNEISVRRAAATVSTLKRFVVEVPDDIPIPGGIVYVRQKQCHYPTGVGCPNHQHVRRYMIPKNAYSLATKSLTQISRARASTATATVSSRGTSRPASARGAPASPRPTTAPVPRAIHRSRLGSHSTRSAWGDVQLICK